MADLSITVQSTIDMVGQDPPNFWNEYNWNAFDWGSGNPVDDVIQDVVKVVSETASTTTDNVNKVVTHLMSGDGFTINTGRRFDMDHLVEGDDITIATTLGFGQRITVISNFLAVHDLSNQTLRDGSGNWCYIHPSDACNAEDRDFTSWAAGSEPSDGFSEVSKPSDGWS
jgi:hypothetical protein